MALVVLYVEVKITVRNFVKDLAAGNVHNVLCIIFGITHVAIALVRLSWFAGQYATLLAASMVC